MRYGQGTGKRLHLTSKQKAAMRLAYERGDSCYDIAQRLGCHRFTVQYHLRRMGVTIRPVGMQTLSQRAKYSGAKHHNWNGGRRVDHGYVLLLMPTHPEARDSYVREHRYVMELHLRQHSPNHPALDPSGGLKRDWTVHHRNGIKTDNRIENLEPLHRSQHHSWMHYHDEIKRLRAENAAMRALLGDPAGIPTS